MLSQSSRQQRKVIRPLLTFYIMCPLRGRTIAINQQTKKTGRIVMTRPEMFNLGYMRLLYYCL